MGESAASAGREASAGTAGAAGAAELAGATGAASEILVGLLFRFCSDFSFMFRGIRSRAKTRRCRMSAAEIAAPILLCSSPVLKNLPIVIVLVSVAPAQGKAASGGRVVVIAVCHVRGICKIKNIIYSSG
jgi:hypothetical protein